jgi:hypothetical protein
MASNSSRAGSLKEAANEIWKSLDILLDELSTCEKARDQALNCQLKAGIEDRERAIRMIERARCIDIIRAIQQQYSARGEASRALTKAIDAIIDEDRS